MSPQLAHTLIPRTGTPPRWLVVLHGIFGRGRNWTTVARRICDARPDWGAILVDLRQHGDSLGFAPPHTIDAAAEDVWALVDRQGWSVTAVLGHSFGGKVALAAAARAPDRLSQVWVVDSTPDARPPSGSAWQLLQLVTALPRRFTSREELVSRLEDHGFAPQIGAWMASNLARADGTYRWRLDFDDMATLLQDFFARDLWSLVDAPPGHCDIHFVKAAESSVLSAEALARCERAARETRRVHVHVVAGGHWVNTENPDAIVELLERHLPA